MLRPARSRLARTALFLLLAALLAALPAASPAAAQNQQPAQLRAFWAAAHNDGYRNHPQVDEMVENAVRGNLNTIFVQVRRHGDAWYNRGFEPRALDSRLAPAAEFDPLQYLLEKAHSMGLKVHAWLVISVTCPRSDPVSRHPQHVCATHGPGVPDPERWTTATFNGEQVGDLDFGHPAAVNHLEQVVENLLRNYPDLDGIHWDYIRYSGPTYGYNQVSLDRFNQAYGRPPGSRPGPNDAQWGQWRRDLVTDVARRLYLRSKAINPLIQVSAATITWGGIGSYHADDWPNSAAYSRVFQDWRAWLQEGILDFAVPMHYFKESDGRHRSWYDGWLNFDRANTGRRTIVVGTGAWLNNADEGIAQIQRALVSDELGRQLNGVALFSYDQPLQGGGRERRRAFMDQLRATVFAQPAPAPVWPWIANPTTGHLMGVARIGEQTVPEARLTLFRGDEWVRDFGAGPDGWYGAVDLAPGAYIVVVRDPHNAERSVTQTFEIVPGVVAHGS